jgi:NADH-quinone oxidoreductase subunit N
MLLYGMSMLYGATGSSTWHRSIAAAAQGDKPRPAAVRRGVHGGGHRLQVRRCAFHMWVPDVYQGAPTAITLFIGSAPKLAAFGMAYRLLAKAAPATVDGHWREMLASWRCCRW